MKNLTTNDSNRQINNLVARIKAHYPHLYEETGGKYIRKILREMLDASSSAAAEPALFVQSSPDRSKQSYSHEKHLQARVIKHKHTQQKAA